MMNKYVKATIYFDRCSDQGYDSERSVLIFRSYEELLSYLCRNFCTLLDYEVISIVRRKKDRS